MNSGLSGEERLRYSRQIRIPEIGESGQLRLRESSVLLVGAGALGSPAAMYLAAAGVGRIGIVDADRVEVSNLQRQVLHGVSWTGRPKTESAMARIREINPLVEVIAHPLRLDPDNAMEIVRGFDLVVDGSDNFATRFLTNDVCFFQGKPLVYGAVQRFEGQIAVFAPHEGGPCYRCLLAKAPPPGSVPSCAEAGVLGVLPGIIGSMQAAEALKCLLGIGRSLIGTMTVYDALQGNFRSVPLAKDPNCRLCGNEACIVSPDNAETRAVAVCAIATLPVDELRRVLTGTFSGMLVDVREPEEHQAGAIAGSLLVPMATLPGVAASWPKDREIVLYCKSGIRSAAAAEWLLAAGFSRVGHLEGGMEAWEDSRELDDPGGSA
jgi:molybdopterin/thiamine biosynthesis adenylyltransferase/rhodanese-related sulfurtransferase